MSFQAGDKVVRVAPIAKDPNYTIVGAPMFKGGVYVVESISPLYEYAEGEEDGIFLIGCRAIWKGHEDVPWVARAFRKLDELKAESKERYYATQATSQP